MRPQTMKRHRLLPNVARCIDEECLRLLQRVSDWDAAECFSGLAIVFFLLLNIYCCNIAPPPKQIVF